MGVPSEEEGGGRWALDHLFLDQDAVPTLVEVKRGGDGPCSAGGVGLSTFGEILDQLPELPLVRVAPFPSLSWLAPWHAIACRRLVRGPLCGSQTTANFSLPWLISLEIASAATL